MKTQKFSFLLLAIALLAALSITWKIGETINTAQSTPVKAKKLVNTVPGHLPIKVKFKNLEKESWVDDFELEVTNISDKPIYLLEFFLVMPDIKSPAGHDTGFSLRYGRGQLIDYKSSLQSEDVPIKPGESYPFKIPETEAKGWKKYKARENKPEPQRLELIFVQINFGDGTGFSGTDGRPVPNLNRQSRNGSCRDEQTGNMNGRS